MVKKKKKKKLKKLKTTRILSADLEHMPEKQAISGIIEARREMLLGTYCNMALIHHTEFEFCLDFIWGLRNQNLLVSRVITSPQHAKKIYRALRENIQKYEDEYGKIHLSKDKS